MAFPLPGISSRRYDRIATPGRDGGVTSFGVINVIGGYAADPLLQRNLRQRIGEDRRIADTVAGHLDVLHLKRVSIDTDVDLAPLATAAGPVFADEPDQKTVRRIVFPANGPLAFARELDASAVNRPTERVSWRHCLRWNWQTEGP